MKKKGLIVIDNLKSKEFPYSVDFVGHNEGSGSPCRNKQEIEECIRGIQARRSEEYTLEIQDKRDKQMKLNT